jgi:peptidyl-tRNA hydrolase
MSDLKQAIIIRKDLNLNKRDLASTVARASLKFIVENNEAERGNQLLVSLSSEEQAWLTGSFSQDILGVTNRDQLDEILFRAEIMGIEAYPVFVPNGSENPDVTCIALGPDEPDVINRLIHSLKPL